jgi:archaellum component FlaC
MTSDKEFEEEFALPEPQRLESAKSYKNRIESVFEKLKTFVKNIFVELMKARNEISRLNNKVDYLKDDISDLTKSNENFIT